MQDTILVVQRDVRTGNRERALKHFMIAVEGGDNDSLKTIQRMCTKGHNFRGVEFVFYVSNALDDGDLGNRMGLYGIREETCK